MSCWFMPMRLLIIILLFTRSTAFAAVSCDSLLAQATQETSAETKDLSASARAYVNLIQHYVKQSDGALDSEIAFKIFKSNSFFNPFASQTNSLAVQITSAMKQLESKISNQDWQQIKSALQNLIEKNKVEVADRQKNESVTSYLFQSKNLSTEIRTKTGGFSWKVLNGRVFFAIEEREDKDWRLGFYEVIDGDLKKFTNRLLFGAQPTLQVANDRLYLFSLTKSGGIEIHELINEKIESVVPGPGLGSGVYSLTNVNERIFALKGPSLYPDMFEVINNELRPILASERTFNGYTNIHAVDDQILFFRTVHAASKSPVVMYILDQDKLIRKHTFNLGISVAMSPQMHRSADGRSFMAARSRDNKVHIYEFKKENLVPTSVIDLPDIPERTQGAEDYLQWFEKEGQPYLIVTHLGRLNILDVNQGQVSFAGKIEMDDLTTLILSPPPFESPLWSAETDIIVFTERYRLYNRHQVKIFEKLKK